MNRFTKLLSTLFFCLTLLNKTSAQEVKHCASTEMQQRVWDTNPQLYKDYLKENARLEVIDKAAYTNRYKNNTRGTGPVYIVPVVFHIIHEYGPENISDAQIKDAVRILNEDFRKLNADTATIAPASFKSIAADVEIEFRLAQKDPNGNCTNGIDRIVSSQTNIGNDGSKLNPWPRANYLNIWTTAAINNSTTGSSGYTYYPGGSPSAAVDGVIIISNYVGSIGTGTARLSTDLTHELGHFFNLNHVWGYTNTAGVTCGDDGVTDTPITKGHNNTCSHTDQTCTAGVIENDQNYMDYSFCYVMFTEGQKTRMRTSITGTASQRDSLWTPTNLQNTGISLPAVLCKADFQSSNTTNTVCQGSSLTFTDLSWNGVPTGRTWSFPGGTPSTSTVQSPVIQYTSAGTYDVALTVTNSSGTVSATKTAYVTVNASTGTYANAFYSEGFEGAAIPNTSWRINNKVPDGNTWIQTSVAAATGTNSVRIVNDSSYDRYIDELVGPSVDMTKIIGANPTLTYKVANAQKASTGLGSADKLQVYVSTNCGLTWVLRQTLTGAALSTAGVNATWSQPASASEWVTKTTSLSGYTSQTNFYFMFRFTSNGGNNVYLDDINISGTTGIKEEIASNLDFNVYPNPAEENAIIAFTLLDKQKVNIKMYDVLGRVVSSVFEGNLNAGEHQYPITAKSSLSSGVYFIKLRVGGESFTKKLIIK